MTSSFCIYLGTLWKKGTFKLRTDVLCCDPDVLKLLTDIGAKLLVFKKTKICFFYDFTVSTIPTNSEIPAFVTMAYDNIIIEHSSYEGVLISP